MTPEEALDFAALGYDVPAARPDAWRDYDPVHPRPGYYEFDWLSSRYPDLYHRFALSTDETIEELHRIIDLSGLRVVDIGAGTGRSAIRLAERAAHVVAVDRYRSVVEFGRRTVERAGAGTVGYVHADRGALPLADGTMDAVTTVWAELEPAEACRVLRPEGLLIQIGSVPEAPTGELSRVLGTGDGPDAWFEPGCPPEDHVESDPVWPPFPMVAGLSHHDFTVRADYGTVTEAAAIVGRIFGPAAETYVRERATAAIAWRARISWCRVEK